MIHVMAATGLGGTTVPAAIVGYYSKTVFQKEQHLRIPIIGRQRPTVAKYDGRTLTPVLVEDFNAVFGGDRFHVEPLCSVVVRIAQIGRGMRSDLVCHCPRRQASYAGN